LGKDTKTAEIRGVGSGRQETKKFKNQNYNSKLKNDRGGIHIKEPEAKIQDSGFRIQDYNHSEP
jgi:hypothetical protein